MSLTELKRWAERHSAPKQSRAKSDAAELVRLIDVDIASHPAAALAARLSLRASCDIVGSWGAPALRPAPTSSFASEPSPDKPEKSSASSDSSDKTQRPQYRDVSLVEPEDAELDWRVLAASVDVDASETIPRGQRRRFALDLRPAVFLSRGGTIEAIVGANCHHYMEFMTVQRSMLLEPLQAAGGTGPSTVARHGGGSGLAPGPEQEAPPAGISVVEAPVPCSKSEVFSNPVLSLLEKRAITRFLMHCVDLIAEADGMKAQQMNDTTLAAGRSLHRPQNKRALDPVFDLAEQERGMPFAAYLRRCGITGRLLRMVLYAVAELASNQEPPKDAVGAGAAPAVGDHSPQSAEHTSAADGMARLLVYLRSVGRFSANAYVTALYGSGDTP